MSYPAFDSLTSFASESRAAIEQFVSYLFGFLSKEHKDDGSHGTVTLDTLTIAAPSSADAGNLSGDLIPTTGNRYSLGAQATSATSFKILGWKDLYLSGTLYRGTATSVGGTFFPAFAETVTASVLTQTGQDTGTRQSWLFVSHASTQLTVGGGIAIAGGPATADGISVPNLKCTGSIDADSGVYERSRTTAMGVWIPVTYAAGNFTASAGTWTVDSGDQLEYTYMLVGKTLWLKYNIATTDVSNAGATLKIAIPGSFVGASGRTQSLLHVASDAGGAKTIALAEVTSGASVVNLYKDLAGSGFSLTAGDNTQVFGTLVIEVQ